MRPVTRSELPIGAILSEKYRVTREIGRGGMAAVYEAEHVDIGKRVAVKVLDPALASSATIVERFHREARAAAAVDSPYICDVHDASRLPDGRPYLVLELLEGESLYDRMSRTERMSPVDVVRILGQVGRGLQKAHAAGIVHRDLKPENIFLARDGDGQEIAKIVDFGLAKFFGTAAPPDGDARLTREGAIFGTPMYMSPEQVNGQGQADHRSDLWALGCIAFECLTGRPVWKVDQGVALIFAQIAAAPVPAASRINPQIPPAFDTWLKRALARAPDERFQSALELAESLAKSLGQDAALALSAPSLVGSQVSIERRLAPTAVESETPDAEAFAPTEPPPARLVSPLEPPVVVRPPTAPPVEPGQAHPAHKSWPLIALIGFATIAAGAGGFLLVRASAPPKPPSPVAASPSSASSSATSAAAPSHSVSTVSSAALSSAPAAASSSPVALPAPVAQIYKAQRLIAQGQREDAVKTLEQAASGSDSGMLLIMLEHARLAAANTGPCRVTGLARPRPFDWTSAARSPSVAVGASSTVFGWIDNQDGRLRWRARATRLDDALIALDRPTDLVPSAGQVEYASVEPAGQGFILTFGDDAIGSRGAYLRQLDPWARPTGPLQRLSASRASVMHPSFALLADGAIAAAFADASAEGPADIMLQRFHADLTSSGASQPIARYAGPASRQSGSTPSIALARDTLVVAWRRENIRENAIVLRAVKVSDGAVAWPAADEEGLIVSEPRTKVRSPEVSCWKDSCLVVWRTEPTGANMASIDAATGTVRWKKVFSSQGTQPGIALHEGGGGLIVWYDDGRVRVAPVDYTGAGESSVVGRVQGEQATPSVAATSRPGEWLVGWTSFEAGHLETFAARVACDR